MLVKEISCAVCGLHIEMWILQAMAGLVILLKYELQYILHQYVSSKSWTKNLQYVMQCVCAVIISSKKSDKINKEKTSNPN